MRKVNITMELDSDEEAHRFDSWIRKYVKVNDFRLLPDTSKLYENDKHFRDIVSKENKIKKVKNDYINEHNF